MALDLKTEIFAYQIFHTFWLADGAIETAPKITEIYGDESREKINFEEVCDKVFMSAISIRHLMFKKLYVAEITDEKAKSLKSLLDCYEYVNDICDREHLFGYLTFFPRMFATLTFILFFCFQVRKIAQEIDFVKYGYMLWSMYFDKFTEEFYEKGGWDRLKRESYFYVYIVPFGVQFDGDDINLREVRQAIVNFCRFTDAIHDQNRWRPLHISKPWIKFRIGYFDSYVRIPLSYELSLNTYEAELLLENLMAIFDPSRCKSDSVNISEEKCQGSDLYRRPSNSKLSYSSENLKTNVYKKNHPFTFEYEKRIINKVLDEFSNIDSDFGIQAGTKCPIYNQEVLTLDITNTIQYLEFDENTLTKMELPKQTCRDDLTKNLHIKSNSLPSINRKKLSGTSIKNLTNIADSDSSCRRSFVNKDEDGKTENFCKENIEKQDKTANTAQVISLNKIQEKSPPENVSALKDFSSENEKVSNGAGESQMIRKAREDLRNEQKDPEIKNFLKMLLILDDMEETKFVLSMLQNNEECSKNSQENTKKQKKKSKKKKNKK